MNTVFMSLALSSLAASITAAAPIQFQSATQQVSLLELYTSEGCSSCPPADAWFNQLKDSPGLWKDFVPVAFHVDYWNSPGWNDRWSAPEYSERQRVYAQTWNAGSVHTPCFVLNGTEWHGWLRYRTIPNSATPAAGELTISSTDTNHWAVTFIPANPTGIEFEVYAVLLATGLGSDVKGGENSGRHLHHEFVALNLVQTQMTIRQGVARAKLISGTSRHGGENIRAIAVWVTRVGESQPVQATGGWLGPRHQ
jgi:hypothetical protein